MTSSLFNAHYTLRRKDATPSERFQAKIERFDWISEQYAQQERRKVARKAQEIYRKSGLL